MEYKGYVIVIGKGEVIVIDKDRKWRIFPTESEAIEWIDEQ